MGHQLLRWFDGSHLRNEAAKKMMSTYELLALEIDSRLADGPEKTTALRKLVESKDAAIRQTILDTEGEQPRRVGPLL